MKYVLKESQFQNAIFKYLDDLFPIEEINWTNPWEEDPDTGEEGEDPNRIEFYKGDFGDEDTCFRWSACEYFNPDSPAQDICPEVVVESPYDVQLNNYFGDLWHEPFKQWFKKNFNLSVKTIATW